MEHRPDFFFGAYILNLMLTLLSLFSLLIFVVICEASHVEPPIVPIIAIGLFCAAVLPFLAYPFTFTVWAVVDLVSEPLELHEIAEALDNLEADRTDAPSTVAHTHC